MVLGTEHRALRTLGKRSPCSYIPSPQLLVRITPQLGVAQDPGFRLSRGFFLTEIQMAIARTKFRNQATWLGHA